MCVNIFMSMHTQSCPERRFTGYACRRLPPHCRRLRPQLPRRLLGRRYPRIETERGRERERERNRKRKNERDTIKGKEKDREREKGERYIEREREVGESRRDLSPRVAMICLYVLVVRGGRCWRRG